MQVDSFDGRAIITAVISSDIFGNATALHSQIAGSSDKESNNKATRDIRAMLAAVNTGSTDESCRHHRGLPNRMATHNGTQINDGMAGYIWRGWRIRKSHQCQDAMPAQYSPSPRMSHDSLLHRPDWSTVQCPVEKSTTNLGDRTRRHTSNSPSLNYEIYP